MCMIDDAEPLAFCSTTLRPARKIHTCDECGRPIGPGETYTYSSFKHPDWDAPETNKTCSHCKVAADWLSIYCGGFCFGAIKEDLVEHYDSGYREGGLQSLVIGIRRRWRAFGGEDLLPVPQFVQRAIATEGGAE